MKTWQKILIPTVISLAIGGGYLLYIFHQRQNPGVVGQVDPNQSLSQDDLAVVRQFFPQYFEDLKRLEGTRVWMLAGYSMPYFPYEKGQVQFTKPVGLIPADQPMDVKKIIKAPVPANVDDRLAHGARQALAVFTMPGSTDTFVTPVGAMEGAGEKYFTDQLFYYDDPHTIYNHWPKDVWAAVDAHQVKPGFSELQTRMAIGMKEHPDGATEGDRTVTYEMLGKKYTITYVKNHATTIKVE